MVRTRLERDESCCSLCRMAARQDVPQCHHFCMRATGLLRVAFAEHAQSIGRNDDTAHTRIWLGQARCTSREFKRPRHVRRNFFTKTDGRSCHCRKRQEGALIQESEP